MLEIPTLADLNLIATLPAMIVAVGMCLILLIDLWIPEDQKERTAWLAQGTLVTAFIANVFIFDHPGEALLGMFVADTVTGFLNIVILTTTFMGILLSIDYMKRTNIEKGEFYSLILLSASGAMFMVSANDLVIIFVALELLSIPLYIMAAFRYPTGKTDPTDPELRSEEAGLKYFILGAFAGAFFVYGAALIYGGTGTTNLTLIFESVAQMGADGFAGTSTILLLLGSGLILVGLGFKVAVFPFHMWTPDVYQGAPTPVTAFMSVAAKVGGFAALARILGSALPAFSIGGSDAAAWQLAVAMVSALTMILGNFVALAQTDIKRMLAYSSIAHAGYILMGVAAASVPSVSPIAMESVVIYLMGYMFSNIGAFAVVLAIEKNDGTGTNLEDFVGLSKSQPLLAALMSLFMLSLIGIPMTSGFIGKYFVFAAAIQAELYVLTVVGVLTSVASVYYYMRVVVNMYQRNDESEGDAALGATRYVNWAVYIGAAGTLLIGVAPVVITNLASNLTIAASLIGF